MVVTTTLSQMRRSTSKVSNIHISNMSVSVRSLDGRHTNVTINIHATIDELRAKIAFELGIPAGDASRIVLRTARSSNLSRSGAAQQRNAISNEIRTMFELNASSAASGRCYLIAENCNDLSPKICFKLAQIMKHWLAPALRADRLIQTALKYLRDIISSIFIGISTNNTVTCRLDRNEVQRVFGRVARGIELLKNLGFVERSGSMTLSPYTDRRSLHVVHGMLATLFDMPAASSLQELRLLSSTASSFDVTTTQQSHASIDRDENEAAFVASMMQYQHLFQTTSRFSSRRRSRLESEPVLVPQRSARNISQSLSSSRMLSSATRAHSSRSNLLRARPEPYLSYEALLRLEDVAVGLDKHVRNLLPLQKLDEIAIERMPEDMRQCSICLMEFSSGEMTMRLPCMHQFHEQCAVRWFEASKKCPQDMREVSVRPSDYGYDIVE